MITISLDEYGHFEENTNEPLFIAGLIYDDLEDLKDNIEERRRIEGYYKMVLNSISDSNYSYSYPMDLHSNDDRKRNSTIVANVKEAVKKSLPEFLTKGTFEGKTIELNGSRLKSRKGKYHIFVMIKSKEGKKALLEETASIFARDNYSVNLYFHMASSVVNRIIFHNPIYSKQMPPINIDIATRSTGDASKLSSDMKAALKKQGFHIKQGSKSDYYSIMDSDIYRTAIAQEMLISGKHKIKINNFMVSSISYESNAYNKEFLYLADSICSVLSFGLEKFRNADEWLGEIDSRVVNLNPDNKNMVFGYDEIDDDFSASWYAYEKHKYYDAISIVYDARQEETEFAKYYSKNWFPYIEDNIKKNISVKTFIDGVDNLYKMLRINNLHKEKLLYILKFFEDLGDKVKNDFNAVEVKARNFFKIYESGMSAFCHVGDAQNAIKYYDKCKSLSGYVGIDEFMRITDKLIVNFEDLFEWDKAIELAKKNIENMELISEIKKDILEVDDNVAFQDEAKAISQYARVLAEKRDMLAEEKFKLALSKLEKNSANYKITQSYLLHFYADMNMKDSYETEATDYFDGNNTYSKRFKYIMKADCGPNSVFSIDYALSVLVRGWFLFGSDDISSELWEKLRNIADLYREKTGKHATGHPWNLIYKYLELLAIKKHDEISQKLFRDLRLNSTEDYGGIVKAIDLYSMTEIANYLNQYEERDKYSTELMQFMKHKFDALKDLLIPNDGEERLKNLDSYFTFMYH